MKIPRFFAFVAALALVVVPRVAKSEGFSPHLAATVEITRSHGYCWFPTVHRFRSGQILVSMTMSADQVNSEGAFSAYCLSSDGGHTWSRRYTLGVGANQDGAWLEEPDAEDRIWQWGSYPEPVTAGDFRHFTAIMTKYGHGGRRVEMDLDVAFATAVPAHFNPTWLHAYRAPHQAPVPDTRILTQFNGRPWGTIVRKPDGSLYSLCYYTTEPDAARVAAEQDNPAPRRFFHSVCLRSTDGGRHWAEQGVIAAVPAGAARPAWMGDEGPNEGSLTVLPDGRLYAIYRTGGKGEAGMIGHAWSSDDGRTWSPLVSTGFRGVAPRLHRLSNGMLAVVTGRPGPVTIHFNLDGRGEHWTKALTVYSEMSTRYTDFLEVEPGRLLVVYDHVPYGWHEIPYSDREARNLIYGTFVELR